MIATTQWQTVCRADQLPVERGVAALVDGVQLALVLTADGGLYAVAHHDPYSGANVIARGIVGSTIIDGEGVPTIASPMYKQVFDLRDGHAIADPAVSLGSWPVRIVDDLVQVGPCGIEPTGVRDG